MLEIPSDLGGNVTAVWSEPLPVLRGAGPERHLHENKVSVTQEDEDAINNV